MSGLLEVLKDRVLLCDGAMGSRVQSMDLDLEADYWGKENCTEVLNLSRPDLVREIHRGYSGSRRRYGGNQQLSAARPITLGEFDLADRAEEINKHRRRELAREATRGAGRRRPQTVIVIGSVGPGTRLPSLGHTDYDSLEAALTVAVRAA